MVSPAARPVGTIAPAIGPLRTACLPSICLVTAAVTPRRPATATPWRAWPLIWPNCTRRWTSGRPIGWAIRWAAGWPSTWPGITQPRCGHSFWKAPRPGWPARVNGRPAGYRTTPWPIASRPWASRLSWPSGNGCRSSPPRCASRPAYWPANAPSACKMQPSAWPVACGAWEPARSLRSGKNWSAFLARCYSSPADWMRNLWLSTSAWPPHSRPPGCAW